MHLLRMHAISLYMLRYLQAPGGVSTLHVLREQTLQTFGLKKSRKNKKKKKTKNEREKNETFSQLRQDPSTTLPKPFSSRLNGASNNGKRRKKKEKKKTTTTTTKPEDCRSRHAQHERDSARNRPVRKTCPLRRNLLNQHAMRTLPASPRSRPIGSPLSSSFKLRSLL